MQDAGESRRKLRANLRDMRCRRRSGARGICDVHTAPGGLFRQVRRGRIAFATGPSRIRIITLANRSPRFRRAVGQETPVGSQLAGVLCSGSGRKG